MTAVKNCSCNHDYQNQRYGVGMRLMNYARKAFNQLGGYRCTVCAKVHGK